MYSNLLIITISLFHIANGFQPWSFQRIGSGSQPNPPILEFCVVWPSQKPQGRTILQIDIINCQPDEICSPEPGFEIFGMALGYN